MFRVVALVALVSSAAAFTPAARGRGQVQMNAASRRDMAKKVGGAIAGALAGAGVIVAAPQESRAGSTAKLSIFGAAPMSSPYATEDDMYSPYSPFGNGEDASYTKGTPDEVKEKIAATKESAKRFPNFKGYIEKKTWLEVYSESQRQMYELRRNMLYLADYKGTKEVKAAAKDFFVKFEAMAGFAKTKNQAAALAAYSEASSALDKYLSLL